MTILTLQFRKKAARDATMTFVRADGTKTGQRTDAFFIGHDLAHYSVETVLNLRYAFLGLVADGWDIGDFGSPWPRGTIPPHAVHDAFLAEQIAGMLDRERIGGMTPVLSADEWNEISVANAPNMPLRRITDAELAQIRARQTRLLKEWQNLPIGETWELPFPAEAS